jgi:hypothetical protein
MTTVPTATTRQSQRFVELAMEGLQGKSDTEPRTSGISRPWAFRARNDHGAALTDWMILEPRPWTGRYRMLGNFPQALSHVALVNTARNLTRAGGPAEDRRHA